MTFQKNRDGEIRRILFCAFLMYTYWIVTMISCVAKNNFPSYDAVVFMVLGLCPVQTSNMLV